MNMSAETLARADDLDHLLRTRGREQRELHPAEHDNVKAYAGVVPAEQHGACRHALFGRSGADGLELAQVEFAEQRQIAQKVECAEEIIVRAHRDR